MESNLVIVESPAKAKTIGKMLGEGYVVKSCFGHIRDLSKKNLGIDVENDFTPKYEVSADKKKIVSELKSLASKADMVWLASDEDREGEAIAWHLSSVLGLQEDKTKRIAFHEITKNAILAAIETPRSLDMNLVMAQQARRVLDRLVGFELSPVLWRKVQPKLSAGRVQSVAVRLIVDKEREIASFEQQQFYKVDAVFVLEGHKKEIKATLDKRFATEQEAYAFLEKCKDAKFSIVAIDKKEGTRAPSAPFTTSLLQQEASRKLGFSVSQTMTLAQKLYEAGIITYMRTDSVNLSTLALHTAKQYITENYGENYSKTRQYQTKSKGAQEAHEAIRPTDLSRVSIEGTAVEKKLYSLIWKRTIASQMANAKVAKTIVSIASDGMEEKFIVEAEQILFDGFMKVYAEGRDDDESEEGKSGTIPNVKIGDLLCQKEISALQRFTSKPARYTEASLVKKMEELGIGRPSTYEPTISTIIKRGYVIKGDRDGEEKSFVTYVLKDNQIEKGVKVEKVGTEKGKFYPENIGMVVTDYLSDNFNNILDYQFTAKIEEDFDKVAAGKKAWNKVIKEFYAPFHGKVEQTISDKQYTHSERVLGTDPESGKVLIARIGRFGPLVQKGANDDPDKVFASMHKGQLIENISLEEALKLFALPRKLGIHNGEEMIVAIGKFGPYVKVGKKYVSLGKSYDPYTITESEAVTLVEQAAEKEANSHILAFPEADIQVLKGRFGPYIKHGKKNFKIPKGTNPALLTLEDCQKIING
ncbi:MAG: type I DNA topoisomerase [Bacteroidales bacterium]|nr:type I DNA topoisomerase [Bacteroidales bacterium]